MPTTLPDRAAGRRRAAMDPAIILICLALWALSLAVVFADGSGSDGDLVPALTLVDP